MEYPPLKPLHGDESLNTVKLEAFRKLTTEELIDSLKPGQPCSLKARPVGTLIEEHHRLKVLRERSVDIDSMARDVILKD